MLISLECVSPEKDILVMCEQYRCGMVRPLPIIYRNFYISPASTQLFGVDIEDFSTHHEVKSPWIFEQICQTVDLLNDGQDMSHSVSIWLQAAEVEPGTVQIARMSFNKPQQLSADEISQQKSTVVLLAALRQYLMEMPEPLFPFSLFDEIKALYLSQHATDNSGDEKSDSIHKLVHGLSSVRYRSLQKLIQCMNRHLHQSSPDSPVTDESMDASFALFNKVLSLWGGLLVRTSVISQLTAHDKHPDRLLKDLIFNCNTVFPPRGQEVEPTASKISQLRPQLKSQQNSSQIEEAQVKEAGDLSGATLDEVNLEELLSDHESSAVQNISPKVVTEIVSKPFDIKVPAPNIAETDKDLLSSSSSIDDVDDESTKLPEVETAADDDSISALALADINLDGHSDISKYSDAEDQ